MSFLLKNIDAIEYIKDLKKKNKLEIFDAVITDPPYNISRDNNFNTIGRAGIKFGSWDYSFDQKTWIYEISPLIKNGGSIIIFNDYKNFGDICKALEESGFVIKDLLRWIKNNPMPRNTNRRYVTDYEYAIWAVKGNGKWTFNKNKNVSYLRPEFRYPVVTSGKNKIHPTQKSLKLMKDIINIHTNKGDLIFDPFSGSGTTGVAAISLGRTFVGTELDSKYFDKSFLRISTAFDKSFSKHYVKRSPLYYLGDKYSILPQIYKYFPKKIVNFYDVFGGGGTLLANVQAEKYFYNDINTRVKNLVQFLKNSKEKTLIKDLLEIIKKRKFTYYDSQVKVSQNPKVNKDPFIKLRKEYNELENKETYKANLMLFLLVIYGFNSQIRFNKNGNFNIPIGKQDLNKNRVDIIKNFINAIKNKDIVFSSMDFIDFLQKHNIKKNDFIYLDPPYLITNATYNDIWDETQDRRLFSLLDKLDEQNIKWAMSNVTSSGIVINKNLEEWSKKYNVYNLNFNYNNSNYRKKSKGNSEVLITNYVNEKL